MENKNFCEILLSNGFTQKEKQNPKRGWLGVDTYSTTNIYTKGNTGVWIMLQWCGMPLPKEQKDWDLYYAFSCKYIKIDITGDLHKSKTPIFETWSGEMPSQEIINLIIK